MKLTEWFCKLIRQHKATALPHPTESAKHPKSDIRSPAHMSTNSATHLQTGPGTVCKYVAEETFDPVPRSEGLPGTPGEPLEDYDPYKPVPKRSRLEIKLDAARHPRRRRHSKHKHMTPKFESATSHLEALLWDLEHYPGRPCWESSCRFGPRSSATDTFDGARNLALFGIAISAAAVADGCVAIRHQFTKKAEQAIHEAALAKRRKYYATETEKRRAVAAEIQAAIPAPENPRPTPAQLLEAYRHRHDDEAAKLYFGRLMIDLEEHERRRLQLAGNKIASISGGVRSWLAENCPELAQHYHTCMRFRRKVQDDPILPESMV